MPGNGIRLRCKRHNLIVHWNAPDRHIHMPVGGLQNAVACSLAEAAEPQVGTNRPRDGSSRSCEAEEVKG